MGIWYGILFKLIVPLLVMYRPIKTLAFSIIVIGIYYGGEPKSLNAFCWVLFCLAYVVLLAFLIWFPKAASAVEFFLIAYYIGVLGLLYVGGHFSSYLGKFYPLVWAYGYELPAWKTKPGFFHSFSHPRVETSANQASRASSSFPDLTPLYTPTQPLVQPPSLFAHLHGHRLQSIS